jgi:ABC-2 type transport system ATP-binding protein
MDNDVAIDIHGLTKIFKLPHEKQNSLKSVFVNFYKRDKSYEEQKALNKVTFDIKKGEFFGVIGRNGSGKSTLLKLIAGIYEPTEGEITVSGQLTPFIELGVGFSPELTGRENVFLNGALLGFSRSEMEKMYESIVSFAELERFMDQKLKNYSSGMMVRLAFSIAIRSKTDILLIDEVLAVGDLAFQEKCYKVFDDIKESGRTVVFISHDGSAIERFCDRVVIIESGKLVAIGKPREMVLEYGALVANEQYENQAKTITESNHQGSGDIRIDKVRILDEKGQKVTNVRFNKPFSIELVYRLIKSINDPVTIGVDIIDESDISILGPNTNELDLKPVIKKSGKIRVDFPNTPISPGTYTITAGIFSENSSMAYDLVDNATIFKIIGRAKHGKISVEPRWTVIENSD